MWNLFKKSREKYEAYGMTSLSNKENTSLANLVKKIKSKKIDDLEIINYVESMSHLPTNCDSAAQSLLSVVGIICSIKPDLAKPLLVFPLQPLYYLGIESMGEVKNYIKWFTSENMEPLDEASIWLNNLINQEELIIDSFYKMYKSEENDSELPDILKNKT